jgi:hypothetical protein
VTLWIGNNDVLGAALRGRAIEGVTLTPKALFRQVYGNVVAALRATGATLVAANLPDVTTIPFVTTIPPIVVNPANRQPVIVNGQTVPLIGPNGPIAQNTLVTLAASSLLAQGIGIPAALGGRGTGLPDEVLLEAGEVTIIREFVTANNLAIREICQAAGVPVLDVNNLLRELAEGGRSYGGIDLSADFLTGGVFSYDGVHPTDLGYAVVANEFINVINANGGSLPHVDLSPFLGTRLAARGSLSAGPQALPEFSREAYEQLLAVFPSLEGQQAP